MIVGKTLAEWIECYQAIIDEPDQIQRVKDYYQGKVLGLQGVEPPAEIESFSQIGHWDGHIHRGHLIAEE